MNSYNIARLLDPYVEPVKGIEMKLRRDAGHRWSLILLVATLISVAVAVVASLLWFR